MGAWKAFDHSAPSFQTPSTHLIGAGRRGALLSPPALPPPLRSRSSDSPARHLSNSVQATTWSPEQPVPGAVISLRCP